MLTPVCVLRASREYQPKHVQWLSRQVPGLLCLSDIPVKGVETIPLKYKWPGWWAKMELFRPDLSTDWLYFDLDTVVVDHRDMLMVDRTTMLSDFYRPQYMASGLMAIFDRDKRAVWEHWMKSPRNCMRRGRTRQCWGDQGIIGEVLHGDQRWQDIMPGAVVSYKVHCRDGLPAEAKAVCFHGKPRPWDSGQDWVPPL